VESVKYLSIPGEQFRIQPKDHCELQAGAIANSSTKTAEDGGPMVVGYRGGNWC
jgi:hypothetical protein